MLPELAEDDADELEVDVVLKRRPQVLIWLDEGLKAD